MSKTILTPQEWHLHDLTAKFLKPFGDRVWIVEDQRVLYVDDSDAAKYLTLMDNPVYASGFHAQTVDLVRLNVNRFLNHPSVRLVDLGPGYPDKTIPIMQEAQKRGTDLTYVPVDVSKAYVDLAATVAARYLPQDKIRPMNISFQEVGNTDLSDDKTKTYYFLGLTIMNFTRGQYVPLFNSMLKNPEDEAVIAAEFITRQNTVDSILAQYETGREFTFSPLKNLGFRMEDTEFKVEYANERVELSHIFKSAAKGYTMSFEKGDRIISAFSYRKPVGKFLDDIKLDFNIRGGDVSLATMGLGTGLMFLQKYPTSPNPTPL